MAVIRKPGSTDWAATTYWDTGAIPVDNDAVSINDGGDDISLNTSQPGIDLLSLSVGPGFTGKVRGLVIDVNQTAAGVFTYEGAGELFEISPGTGAVIAKLIHRASNSRTKLVVGGTGVVTTAEIVRGLAMFAGTIQVPTLNIMGGHAILEYNAANACTNISVFNGKLTALRDWTGTLTVGGGAVVEYEGYGNAAAISAGAVVMDGGTLLWKDGILGNITGRAGVLDYSQIKRPGLSAGTVAEWASFMEITPMAESLKPTFGTRTLTGGGSVKIAKG